MGCDRCLQPRGVRTWGQEQHAREESGGAEGASYAGSAGGDGEGKAKAMRWGWQPRVGEGGEWVCGELEGYWRDVGVV